MAPTLREIRKRKLIVKSVTPVNRSSFTDWNPSAELFAFSKRLSEDFPLPVLQRAFIQKSYIAQEIERQKEIGIETPSLEVEDNQNLIASGSKLLNSFVENFIRVEFSLAPNKLRSSIKEHLLSNETLSNISKHLGTTELILSADFPVVSETLADTFRAVVGALAEGCGEERANRFIYDFVCTQLSQLDCSTLWNPENSFEELQKTCATHNLNIPEPRLIGQCGTNTLLASYNVGIYCDKKMIGSGFGETVEIAISEASSDALRGIYKIRPHELVQHF